MIFKNPNIIFLHIPKTAGNYFTNLFINYSMDEKVIRNASVQDGIDRFSISGPITKFKHHKLNFYNSHLDLTKYEIFFIFRDPTDRLLSAFFSPNRIIEQKKRGSPVKFTYRNFKNFIINQPSILDFINQPSFMNELKKFFLIYNFKTFKVKKIYYLRFNNLENDIIKFSEKYNFLIDPGLFKNHFNKSFHEDEKNKLMLDEKVKQIINTSHHYLDRELLKDLIAIN